MTGRRFQPCPVCGCLGLGAYALAVHLGRRHGIATPPDQLDAFNERQRAAIDDALRWHREA